MGGDTIAAVFRATAAEFSDKSALTFLRSGCRETELSFAELNADVNRCACVLYERGVGKGDRVAMFLPKSLFSVVLHFAIQMIGAVAVPFNPGFKENEMRYLLADSTPTLVISESDAAGFLQRLCPETRILEVETAKEYRELSIWNRGYVEDSFSLIDVAPDDPALIIYTSGTTGNPKGAVLSHRNLLHDAANIREVWEISDRDVICHALPLFHVHGLCFAMQTPLLSGAHITLLDAFRAEHVLAELSRDKGGHIPSIFMAVPAMYTKLMDYAAGREFSFAHLRLLTSGSAPLPEKEFARISRFFGREPVEREGMSETGMNFTNPVRGEKVPGSIGVPLPGLQVKIVDPNTHEELGDGEIGELWLKSDAIIKKYWQKPEETAKAFVGDWFRTGDLCRVDEKGYFYLTDRIKHIIISGGENISAKEVETVINSIDGVDESVVVGRDDEKWGEIVVAAVKLRVGAVLTEGDINAFCRRKLHDWKCPKEIKFVSEIPRNTMGKVLKEQVKKFFLTERKMSLDASVIVSCLQLSP